MMNRHIFLCYKTPEAWPLLIEGSESDPLPKFFASALKARKNDITVKTLLTVIEGHEGTKFSDGDVLIFPQMNKYRGLKESNVDSFVDDVLVNDKPWASGVQESLTGSHVFTAACFHTGGHNGNLIIYSPGSDGSITGHWYGDVTPDDVPELLDEHIGKGKIIERLWRGQIGASSDEVDEIEDKPQEKGNQIGNSENDARKDALGKLLSLIGELLSCCRGWSSGNRGCGL
ncbi:hypothetical protein ACFX13_045658 [Malus domestica]